MPYNITMTEIKNKKKKTVLSVPKQKYNFPLYGAVIEAESIDEATRLLKEKLKGIKND